MANRRIEMYQYRQVLHRMRCGDSNREICAVTPHGPAQGKEGAGSGAARGLAGP